MLIFMTAELQIRQDGKIPSGEKQNRYLMLFDDRHGFTALQAVQSGSFFLYMRRRIQPAPSEGRGVHVSRSPQA
jgi:hypothetical protein